MRAPALALAVALAAFAASAATAAGPALWPAPADPMARTVAAGLVPERHESFEHHVHAHLDVFLNGRLVRVPAGIGIDIHDPAVRVFPTPDGTKAYGGISQCPKVCISPLHTHDDTGILHTESKSSVPNTLGQFFTEWGVVLTRTCVGGYCHLASPHVYLDGKPYSGDPRGIKLVDRLEIAIVIGKPPKKIPVKGNFAGA
ncbi:MAG TPA: hypothetical protein VFI01_08205 [Gaiellaceae bacterium]|nr:hypothetical protein [Gaiellaceae bacterium]